MAQRQRKVCVYARACTIANTRLPVVTCLPARMKSKRERPEGKVIDNPMTGLGAHWNPTKHRDPVG